MVLLVGEAANNSLQLLQWLKRRGCRCEVAQSYREAFNLVSRTQFDLVLSQYQLPDRTAFPLLDWLVGSPATLFFSARDRKRLFVVKDARTRQTMYQCTSTAVECVDRREKRACPCGNGWSYVFRRVLGPVFPVGGQCEL